MIYLSYLLGNFAILRARLNGWPKADAPFKLGVWGKVVNVLGILWGAAMLINFWWPSAGDSAFSANASYRIFSNPTADQTDYYTKGDRLVSFGIHFLNKIPIIELVMVFILILGAIYYLGVQRSKPAETVVIPEPQTATP
jgi:hypothetical protein